MKRSLSLLFLFVVTICACAGWAFAKSADEPGWKDYRRLNGLADELLQAEDKLLVVTVRGEGKKEVVQRLVDRMQPYGKIGCEQNRCDYTLRFTAQGAQESETGVHIWMKRTSAELRDSRLTGAWNVNIQGTLAEGRTIDSIWGHIEKSVKADIVDSYEDAGSRSVSYQSSKFESSVKTAAHTIHLQAAAHRSTETNEWRVTLGTPVILIEY